MKQLFLITIISISLFSCKNNEEKKNTIAVPPADTAKTKVIDFIFNKDSVVQSGESIQRYKNGAVKMKGLMKGGKRDGIWKSYYENSTPWSESTFNKGIKTGKTTTWYPNGQKRYEGFYTNDKQTGKWIYYDVKGKVLDKKDYGN